jgi:hypothetical protein
MQDPYQIHKLEGLKAELAVAWKEDLQRRIRKLQVARSRSKGNGKGKGKSGTEEEDAELEEEEKDAREMREEIEQEIKECERRIREEE